MSEKLLPCPFCGSDQLVVKPNAFDGLLRVQCEGCWATSVTSNQKKVAVAAWNTRVGVAPEPTGCGDPACKDAACTYAFEPTDEQINAAAEVMWNDRDARHGGSWPSRGSNEICVIQTRATARAALIAASRLEGALSPSTASSDKVRPDAEWLTAKHAEFDNIFVTTPTPSAATSDEPVVDLETLAQVFEDICRELGVSNNEDALLAIRRLKSVATEAEIRELYSDEDDDPTEPMPEVIATHDGEWRREASYWRFHDYPETPAVHVVTIAQPRKEGDTHD